MADDESSAKDIGPSSVVQAFIYDVQDRNGKTRPCLVIKSEELKVLVLAITTTFDPDNLQPDEIKLPYSENCGTGLDKPNVVKCKWFDVIELRRCILVGRIPAKLMGPIIETFRRVNSESEVKVKLQQRKNECP